MNSQIAKTSLWAISLGSKEADQEIERKKELLRGVLLRFREHASVVTSRISATFPDLTVHDVTHLDALWEIAGLIAGENYPLNPLEAFVFGGAVLLHDAAHCFEPQTFYSPSFDGAAFHWTIGRRRTGYREWMQINPTQPKAVYCLPPITRSNRATPTRGG